MELENFLKLVLSNPDNISISYSNINGKEKLVVNGKEIETYDDSEVKEKIKEYKEYLESIDDCLFCKIMDEAENRDFDLTEMNNALDLESFNEDEANHAYEVISEINNLINEVITKEIDRLKKLIKTDI